MRHFDGLLWIAKNYGSRSKVTYIVSWSVIQTMIGLKEIHGGISYVQEIKGEISIQASSHI